MQKKKNCRRSVARHHTSNEKLVFHATYGTIGVRLRVTWSSVAFHGRSMSTPVPYTEKQNKMQKPCRNRLCGHGSVHGCLAHKPQKQQSTTVKIEHRPLHMGCERKGGYHIRLKGLSSACSLVAGDEATDGSREQHLLQTSLTHGELSGGVLWCVMVQPTCMCDIQGHTCNTQCLSRPPIHFFRIYVSCVNKRPLLHPETRDSVGTQCVPTCEKRKTGQRTPFGEPTWRETPRALPGATTAGAADFFCRHQRGAYRFWGLVGWANAVLAPHAGRRDGIAATEAPRELVIWWYVARVSLGV